MVYAKVVFNQGHRALAIYRDSDPNIPVATVPINKGELVAAIAPQVTVAADEDGDVMVTLG